jgi:hypothetical protein
MFQTPPCHEWLAGFGIWRGNPVAGGYLYVTRYANGLQIFDIKDPASPVRVGHYLDGAIPPAWQYWATLPCWCLVLGILCQVCMCRYPESGEPTRVGVYQVIVTPAL